MPTDSSETTTEPTLNTLAGAQAFNACIVRHIHSLIETTKLKGAPNSATLIAACEMMLRKSWHAGQEAMTNGR